MPSTATVLASPYTTNSSVTSNPAYSSRTSVDDKYREDKRFALRTPRTPKAEKRLESPSASSVSTASTTNKSNRRTTLRDKYGSADRVMTAETIPTAKVASRTTTMTPKKKVQSSSSNTNNNNNALEELTNNLQRYTRVNDRRNVIKALTDCRKLRAVPIDGSPSAPTNQEEWRSLEREVCFTSVELNGLIFPAASSSQILKVLKELCNELCRESRLSPTSVYQAMIVRLARTTSSADSYFQLNALLGSRDLVLQPRAAATPANTLAMYCADDAIHVNLTTYHPYGLFRRCDVTSNKAWIPLQAAIHERVNFLTGDCFRHVGVEVVPDN